MIITKKVETSLSEHLATEEAILMVKRIFEQALSRALDLTRVSAPMVVLRGTGLNDDLNGVERAVNFPIKDMQERRAEVVHSLAKWKRQRLGQLGIPAGKGIVTDMRALRPDEELGPVHSITVDQWDWEKHITAKDRRISYLTATVQKIYSALLHTEQVVFETYPELPPSLPKHIHFITARDLYERYPELTAKERENLIVRQFGAVFIMGIGGRLGQGEPHDGRAPDYDDWSTRNESGFMGLNGDLLVWHPVLQQAIELSSMGIRVDKEALLRQLEIQGLSERAELPFHQQILQDEIPLSIGGGIGQSRLVMFLLRKAHIGEVQASIWPAAMREECQAKGIHLL